MFEYQLVVYVYCLILLKLLFSQYPLCIFWRGRSGRILIIIRRLEIKFLNYISYSLYGTYQCGSIIVTRPRLYQYIYI